MKILVLTLLVALSGCTRKTDTINVNKEFCKSQYTGRQDTVTDVSYVCMAYNQQMVCTNNVPVYSDRLIQEVETSCAWREWQ